MNGVVFIAIIVAIILVIWLFSVSSRLNNIEKKVDNSAPEVITELLKKMYGTTESAQDMVREITNSVEKVRNGVMIMENRSSDANKIYEATTRSITENIGKTTEILEDMKKAMSYFNDKIDSKLNKQQEEVEKLISEIRQSVNNTVRENRDEISKVLSNNRNSFNQVMNEVSESIRRSFVEIMAKETDVVLRYMNMLNQKTFSTSVDAFTSTHEKSFMEFQKQIYDMNQNISALLLENQISMIQLVENTNLQLIESRSKTTNSVIASLQEKMKEINKKDSNIIFNHAKESLGIIEKSAGLRGIIDSADSQSVTPDSVNESFLGAAGLSKHNENDKPEEDSGTIVQDEVAANT